MRPLGWSLSLLLLSSTVASASSLRAREVPQRTAQADRVVLAEVLGSEVRVPDGDVHRMTTVISVVVLEDYKGHGPRRLELSQLGGQSGLWKLEISGAPTWEPGETAVLFLRCSDAAHPDQCVVSGLSEGKVPVVGRPGAQDVLLSDDRTRGPKRLRLEQLADQIKVSLKDGAR